MALTTSFQPFVSYLAFPSSSRGPQASASPASTAAAPSESPRHYLRPQTFEERVPQAESFRQFMRRALYHPERGYYTANIATVGGRGDFSTSATLSPLLGKAIAGWLRQELKALPGIRTIIEVGGGDGSLMESVLRSLGMWRRMGKRILMVEASPVLKSQQRLRLNKHVNAWHNTLRDALEACKGEALIFHNELLDAFPVSLVQWSEQARQWQEIWLRHAADGTCTEELRPLPMSSEDHSTLGVWPAKRLVDGQRCELHEDLRAWLPSWMPAWRRGAMLSIDYGDLFPTLYHRQPHGTLRGYLLQQRLSGSDIYTNVGLQDLTSDVNFTDLRQWLQRHGCEETSYQTQAEFIAQWTPGKGKPKSAADAFITDPHGAGSAFKCLAVRQLGIH